MSRFKAPSKGDRHASGNGTPVGVAQKRRNELPVPDLREGDRRCPVCRNSVHLTPNGLLRSHSDLFGVHCWNKSTGEASGVVAPPIHLPPEPIAPLRPIRNEPERFDRADGSRLDCGSECRECGKWLPGERSLCGCCYVLGGGR